MNWDDFLKEAEERRIGVDENGISKEWLLSSPNSAWSRCMAGGSTGSTTPAYSTPALEDER